MTKQNFTSIFIAGLLLTTAIAFYSVELATTITSYLLVVSFIAYHAIKPTGESKGKNTELTPEKLFVKNTAQVAGVLFWLFTFIKFVVIVYGESVSAAFDTTYTVFIFFFLFFGAHHGIHVNFWSLKVE